MANLVLHGLKHRGFNGERNAIQFYDFRTEFHDCIPVKSRKTVNADDAFRQFFGPDEKAKLSILTGHRNCSKLVRSTVIMTDRAFRLLPRPMQLPRTR